MTAEEKRAKNLIYCCRWREKNKERYLAYQRDYQWNAPRNNHGRLSWILRCRINGALKGKGKSASLVSLLGCSVDAFKKHIESHFVPGMSWENRGEVWHIDHKKPCAQFDLSKPEEQSACFHFSNQFPMFATENLQKSDGGKRRKSL